LKTLDTAPVLRPQSNWQKTSDMLPEVPWPVVARRALSIAAVASLVILVVWSAILTKTARGGLPLADIRQERLVPILANNSYITSTIVETRVSEPSAVVTPVAPPNKWATDPEVRWFNGRPVKPARALWMTVTAYSPDARSCGTSADGITATLHSVETNGFHLAAADPQMLPYGSMLSIDGYDKGQIVPVLDCGSAIKGHRLDVLFPTHEQARSWGVRRIKVTLWAYSDGKPAENPRNLR